MKKHLILVFFLFFSYVTTSQVLIALLLGDKLNTGKIEFGLDGGFNYSSISGFDNRDYLRSFNLGFYFDIKMKEQWYLNTGVLVKSSLGTDKLSQEDLITLGATIYNLDVDGINPEGDYSQKINGFLVPVLAKYKFKNNFHAEIGPQFGLNYKGWIEYNYEEDTVEGRLKEENTELINWFEMGATAGVGYRFLKGLGWTVGVRYYYGFTNIYKGVSGSNNDAVYIKLYIPIGASDEKKEEIKEMKALLKTKKEEKKAAKNKKGEERK